jgi:hypothetical protein
MASGVSALLIPILLPELSYPMQAMYATAIFDSSGHGLLTMARFHNLTWSDAIVANMTLSLVYANPYQSLYDMVEPMFVIGFIAGMSGIAIVAIGSRLRR